METFKRAFKPDRGQDQETTAADKDLRDIESVTGLGKGKREELGPEAQKELQQLRSSLQSSNIQTSRMQHHAFEPVSLPGSQPASRVSIACENISESFPNS